MPKFLNNLDLNGNQLLNPVIHVSSQSTTTNGPNGDTTGTEGQIFYNSHSNGKQLYFRDNSSWRPIGDISGVTAGAGLSGGGSSGDLSIAIDISEFSAVTPASGDSFLTLDSDGSTEQLTTVSALQTYMQNNLTFTTNTNLSQENVEDFVGGMLDGTETGISVSYDDTDGNIDFVVADSDFALTGDVTASVTQTAKGNVSLATTIASGAVHHGMLNDDIISGQGELASGLASTDELMISDAGTVKRMDVSVIQSYLQSNLTFTSNTDVDVSNANLLTRLAALESSGGASNENIVIGTDSGDTIVITGNLQVSGTTTTVNSTTVNLNDHNIVLDSGNSTSAVVDGAGITIEGGSGDDATFTYNATTNAFDFKLGSSFENIKADGITGTILTASQTNITGVGTISTGVWQGTAIASAYLDADTAHLTTSQTFTGAKTFETASFTNSETDEAGSLTIKEAADNGTHLVTLTVPASLTNSNTTITVPYTGGAAYMAVFAADPGTSTITSTPAELNLLDSSTAGTVVNSKGVVYGSSGQVAATTIELGHASDTTLARSAAGKATIEGQLIGVVETFHLDHSDSHVAANNTSSDSTEFTITHGMGSSRFYKVEVIQDSGNYDTVYVDVTRPSDTTIKVTFGAAVANGAYRAMVTRMA